MTLQAASVKSVNDDLLFFLFQNKEYTISSSEKKK